MNEPGDASQNRKDPSRPECPSAKVGFRILVDPLGAFPGDEYE
jgi:hypothetical protein